MTTTATETTVETTVETTPATDTTKPASKASKPATVEPKPATDAAAIAKLEAQAVRQVGLASKAGLALAPIITELFVREAWTVHELAPVDYWATVLGIGESGVSLAKSARQETVRLMASAAPGAPISALAQMCGCSLRTVARDREEWDLQNPARSLSHKKQDDDAQDDDEQGDETKPAKPSTKVKTINVIEILDAVQDVAFLQSVLTHVVQRIAALSVPESPVAPKAAA